MKEGADGTLFASYSSGPRLGTWRYDYGPNTWTQMTSWTASTLSASTDNTLFAAFSGEGTYEFHNGSWQGSEIGVGSIFGPPGNMKCQFGFPDRTEIGVSSVFQTEK